MWTQSKIRKASKSLVLAYVHHINKRVQEGNFSYISLGIDTNVRLYEALFNTVLAKTLNLPFRATLEFSDKVVVECVDILSDVIDLQGYRKLFDNAIISECVFDVCSLIIKQVVEVEKPNLHGKKV